MCNLDVLANPMCHPVVGDPLFAVHCFRQARDTVHDRMEVVIDVADSGTAHGTGQMASATVVTPSDASTTTATAAATSRAATSPAAQEQGATEGGEGEGVQLAEDIFTVFATEEGGVPVGDVDGEPASADELQDTLTSMHNAHMAEEGRYELENMSFHDLLWGNWDGIDMTSELLKSLEAGLEEVNRSRPTELGAEDGDNDEPFDINELLQQHAEQQHVRQGGSGV